MPSSTSTTLEAIPAASFARDLGEQYERLHGAESILLFPPSADGSANALVVPKGKDVVSIKKLLDEYRTAPERRTGTAKIRDLASFVAHVNRFKDADSALFANPDRQSPSLTAVYDYHQALEGRADPAEAHPRFGVHRAVYSCPTSPEWKTWTGADGRRMDQGEFAAFLEDHITDVVMPPDTTAPDFDREKEAGLLALVDSIGGRLGGPSALMLLARGLSINVETAVSDVRTLDTGEIKVVYAETHRDGAGAPMSVPNLFLLGIPVFESGDVYRIPIRLRYRLQGGKLTWSFHLYRADRAFDDAFNGLCDTAAGATGLPLFRGAPEA